MNDLIEDMNIEENSNRFRRLNRALFGDPSGKIRTFAILSPENPRGIKADAMSNKQAVDSLKQQLKHLNLTYTPIKGSYGSIEHSFIIFNCSLNDAKMLAANFEQESFFWGITNKEGTSNIGYYETPMGSINYRCKEVCNQVSYEDEATDFFSKFGIKFRINMQVFGDDVPEIEHPAEFDESLNEERTPMSRALHRRNSRK